MRYGLSGRAFLTVSVWECLEAAARFGYACVALDAAQAHPGLGEREIARIRMELDKHRLSVELIDSAMGGRAHCEEMPPDFGDVAALAKRLGARHILVRPGGVASAQATDAMCRRAALWLRQAAAAAAARGCGLVLETDADTLCDTPEACVRMLDAIAADGVGLLLRPAALYRAGAAVTRGAVEALGGRILAVEAADAVRLAGRDGADASWHARRVGQGAVDWQGICRGLQEAGFAGAMILGGEGGEGMPARAAFARAGMQDLRMLAGQGYDKEGWLHLSPEAPGMHTVIAPRISDCRSVWVYRLNLSSGESYALETGGQEMNAVLIRGGAAAAADAFSERMSPLDSFYLPGGHRATLTACEDSVFYLGAAVCEGHGTAFYRRYDPSLPLGDIHQIHGAGSGLREVFFTLEPGAKASRLLCGITHSRDGQWTSWPPHQHERDLEEVYCYFNIPAPRFGLHLSYADSGDVEDMAVHAVREGTMVLAPRGYHPTVATPGIRNAYFWVLAAHSHDRRRYDLAVNDPAFDPS